MLKVSALRILVIAGGLALTTLSFSRDARAATVLYRTDAQLVAVSERVVHGRVLDVRMERAPGGRRTIYTVARIAVLEDFTGGADEVIEVRELGGVIDGVQMWVPGTPVFVPGQDIVLCLERAGNDARVGVRWRWNSPRSASTRRAMATRCSRATRRNRP